MLLKVLYYFLFLNANNDSLALQTILNQALVTVCWHDTIYQKIEADKTPQGNCIVPTDGFMNVARVLQGIVTICGQDDALKAEGGAKM